MSQLWMAKRARAFNSGSLTFGIHQSVNLPNHAAAIELS